MGHVLDPVSLLSQDRKAFPYFPEDARDQTFDILPDEGEGFTVLFARYDKAGGTDLDIHRIP